MEKHFLREKLIADFKALKVKVNTEVEADPVEIVAQKPEPKPPTERPRVKTVNGREIKIFLDREKIANLKNRKSKVIPQAQNVIRNSNDALVQQYMQARKVGDDSLAECIFIQLAHLDQNA